MPKISIILPSFNVAVYIRECIESVIHQTISDIEILCIDAGSTDGTYEILEAYAVRDHRIRLIPSDKKSYGYQINRGIDMAKGEYLGIVETDDCIEPDMYQVLYETATAHNLDYVKAGFYTLVTPYPKESYLLEYPFYDCDRIISYQYFMENKLSPDIYIWNGLYHLSFLRKFHIRLNETPGAAFQDCGFRYLTDMNLRRGMFLSRFFYHYRRDNATSSTYHPRFDEYKISEFRYIRKRMEGLMDRARQAFFARETVMMALSPYTTYREHSQPNEAIFAVLDEFRQIMIKDREEGLLKQEEMLPQHWIEMCLFTEKPASYEDYIEIKAKADYELYGGFIKKMEEKEQIVVFGSGKVAKFALCLMRMNQLENIVAVCDNNEEKWGESYYGHTILSPKEAVKRYPQAYYLAANKKCPAEIFEQLVEYGIKKEQMSAYTLPLQAFGSTNLFMRKHV